MKKLTLAIFLISSFNSALIGQDLETVMDNYLEATGMNNPGSIQSMYISLEMSTQGNNLPMEIYLKRPDKVNITMVMQDQEMIMNKNGEETWMVNPMTGSSEPGPMPPGQEGSLDEAMNNIDGRFATYKDNPQDYEYLGNEEIDGKDFSKVKAIIQQGGQSIETINYFDNNNHLLIKQTMDIMGQSAENYFENYREVDGYSMPFIMTTKVGGNVMNKMTFTKVEINQEIDDAIFAKP
ncbi:MAG: LolA family protein [Cyclobacteriaceae bacterium]